ncbi:uncharacterized protein LOC143364269 [Halictus rubicundus]|uniref:uncharacterized protein LOC143364269 n=1 Tax=Halictus rubicundus TaxID=77578 RepID=UPI0040363E95
MADLVGNQRIIGQRISRIVVNLKKRGKANISMGMLQAGLSTLQELWADFRKGDSLVRAAAETDTKVRESSYLKADEYEDVQQDFIEQSGLLRDMISELQAAATVKEAANSNSTAGETTSARSRAVLPKMSLPTFDGQYKDWPPFRDLFTSLIIADASLSPVERLHYLKGCMKGSAASLLKNVKTTAENFQVAWEKLEDRFENRRLLVQAQIRLLTKLPPVHKESSAEMQRLFDETFDAVDALANLDRPVTNATDWIVELTVERLDRQSRREWEESVKFCKELPTLEQLKTFMIGRLQTCEALEAPQPEGTAPRKTSQARGFKVHQVSKVGAAGRSCCLCQDQHYIQNCRQFRDQTPAERKDTVRRLSLCFNCLGNHQAHDCKSAKRCQRCEGKHHTMIHDAAPPTQENSSAGIHVQQVSTPVSSSAVILGTARVSVLGPLGHRSLVRVLIDPGSEVSLVSEALAQRLGLRRNQARIPLRGVGRSRAQFTRGKTELTISTHHGQETPLRIQAYVISELSTYQPRHLPSPGGWPHIQGLKLADPGFHHSDPVDILLGAESYDLILLEGVKKGPPHTPVAQETLFGWILTGGSRSASCRGSADRVEAPVHHCRVDRELMASLSRFWEQEEIEVSIPVTEEDRRAEDHFAASYNRQPDGRFMVRLPFKTRPELGESRRTAVRTLDGLSSKFRRSTEFRVAYQDFLATYEALGHMSSTSPSHVNTYYLPHHGVLRESSTTTKLRVVFNGSMPTSNGKSINDFLLRGPNLLPNLADVLLKWRRHRFVFSADIEKMYRQILVHPEDRRWQRIVWRPAQREGIVDYELSTVTYGLACAPYLAIRCLHQLAQLEEHRYPRGSQAVQRDIYMDDVLTGADSLPEARSKQQEIRELLMAGGFPLRKWAANSRELLEVLSPEERKGIVEWDSPTSHSVLGIRWLPSLDCFQVSAAASTRNSGYTKRSVLSGTAQLFDPLGWLAPVTIVAKVLMQSLWLLKVDWDAPLPDKEDLLWQKFQQQLPTLQTVSVPRWLGICGPNQALEIHGFADASERAYAAVVYSRTVNEEGAATVSLIVAKSRVAPLKRVSLPRLELCAAFLLARLVQHVCKVLDLQDADLHLWSDSSVALSWIQGHPSRWPTYVANRVAEIQRMTPFDKLHHVRSAENPAGCASRGLYPSELPSFDLWWRGPGWLTSPGHPRDSSGPEASDEGAELAVHHVVRRLESPSGSMIERFSNLTRLLRVLAWCRRWIPGRRNGESTLSASEVHACQLTLLRQEQASHFEEEIRALRKGQPVPARSRLAKLSPFMDADGVLRVGGRLQVANLAYDRTHPAILPDDSPLARLWVDAAHRRCLHGGTQLTLATLRQECWILKGRPMVKSCIRRCITCIRWRGQTALTKMGNLPVTRVTPCRPFFRSGIDYAGPIQLRAGRGRGQRTSKGYIAVFICLSTKAVHLEAASDGSTDAFLGALRRFTARRGRCAELYSDCGRNFVGANHELRALLREAGNQGEGHFAAASREGIRWKFNPPSAPHFGGIWEAAVKSVKHHLRRIIGEQRLTFEELTTLLTGIEACLNSRPLTPLSDDPEDPVALTPGHFLIGEPLTAIPEPSLADLPASRLNRWQLVQQMQQHFWKRWSREYLNSLQPRVKWLQDKARIKAGALVLIKSEILPPTQWPLARVVTVHPGPDASIRVATVRTGTSQFLRPVHKLIPLLPPDDGEGGTSEASETDRMSDSPDPRLQNSQ